jgi:hypothetical protein
MDDDDVSRFRNHAILGQTLNVMQQARAAGFPLLL